VNDVFRTRDLYEASAIYAWGEKEFILEPSEEFYWFIFKNGKTCQKLSEVYWAEKGSLPPKKYVDAIQTLKDRLFAKRGMNYGEKRFYSNIK